MNNENANKVPGTENSDVDKHKSAADGLTPERSAALISENTHLKAELHIRSAVFDLEKQLEKLGALSPGLLSGTAKGLFQLDETGQAVNLEAVAEKLRRDHPEQFVTAADPPASIDAAAGRNSGPPITKEALARMTPDEIRGLDWAAVRAALKG